MKKNTLWVYAMLTALLLVLFGIPSALAAGTPTRTENLDLTALNCHGGSSGRRGLEMGADAGGRHTDAAEFLSEMSA